MSPLKPIKGRVLPIATILAIGGIVFAHQFVSRNSPHRLLLRAYSTQRYLELRIPGAPRGEFQANRQSRNSAFDEPTDLLEAQVQIGNQLNGRPDDPALLNESGEVSLLTFSYESAITSIQKALNSNFNSPELLNNLATGYFERGEAEQRFMDYALAFELQSRALKIEPDNPTVLFNRAITSERLFLFRQSIEDWNNYLRLDPSGGWALEAQSRRAAARSRFEAHQDRIHVPLMSPDVFSKTINSLDPTTWTPAESRIDSYLEVALTSWLPDAFSNNKETIKSRTAKDALAKLATVLCERNSDFWLHDLIVHGATKDMSRPVALLSQAIVADNIDENFVRGREQSRDAARLFEQHGNSTGAMRARFEEIYALHFSDAGGQCLNAISALRPQLSKRRYSWLNIQLQLEEKICLIDEDNLGFSEDVAQRATKASLLAHYPKLHLRAMGFLGDVERLEGKKLAAWRICQDALREYWVGSTDDVSGYNIYTLLDDLAEGEQLWNLDVAVDREALTEGQAFHDPLTKAALSAHLGVAATKTNDNRIAEESFNTAEKLLDEAPPNDVSQNYRAGIDIDRSRLAVESNQVDMALKILSEVRPKLTSISNDSIQADYYEVMAEAQTAARHSDFAIRSLDAAVKIAEKRRLSLRTRIDRTIWTRDTAHLFSQLVELKLQSQDSLGALLTLEDYADVFSEVSTKWDPRHHDPPTPISTEREQEKRARDVLPRPSSATVLVYSPLSDGVAIWKLNNEGVAYRKVSKDPRYIRLLVERFAELCSTPSSPLASVESTSKQLHELLIAPISDQLRQNDTLLIVPGDLLAGVPFQALRDKDDHYLIQIHPVIYAPGFRYISNLAIDEPVTSKMSVLAVANASNFISPDLPRLPDAIAEAEDAVSHFQHAHILVNEDATLTNVRQNLREADVFHFAGHTVSLAGHEGLLLADGHDGREISPILDLLQLERLNIAHLKLVILSSCSTGKEQGNSENEGSPESLAHGFVQRGVAHVIATRWNLDSSSSARLMRVFYRSLLSGRPVARAMAASEEEVLLTEPHPYYWAVYEVFGQQ